MPITHRSTVRAVAALLILACITQAVYTALYVAKLDVPRQLLWGTEGLLFPLLAALARAAMVRSERLTLAFAAIAFAAVLNFLQVGVGLTLFFPFSDAAKADPALAPVAGAIVAFAFFTFANLAPRAHQHHAWYKQKFDDYPSHRRAVLPFVL